MKNKKMIRQLIYILFGIFFVVVVIFFVAGKMIEGYRYDVHAQVRSDFSREEVQISKEIAKILERRVATTLDQLEIIAQIENVKSGIQPQCNNAFREISAKMSIPLGNIGRVDVDGRFICGVLDTAMGFDGTQFQFIRDILADPAHAPVMGRAIMFPYLDHEQYLIAIHVPVFTADGVFDGTVGAALYFPDIQEKYLQNILVREGSFITLVDDDGMILLNKNNLLLGESIYTGTGSFPEEFLSVIRSVVSVWGYGKAEYNLEGIHYLAAYATSTVFPDRRWGVIVSVPSHEVDFVVESLLATFRLRLLLLFSLMSLFVILVGLLLMRWNYLLTQDITERIQKTETLLQSIGEGVIVIDRNWKITHWNAAAERITGWKRNAVYKKSLLDVIRFLRATDRVEITHLVEDTMVYGKLNHLDANVVIVGNGGREVPISDSVAPVLDDNNNVVGAIIVFRDMTKVRELEHTHSDFSYASHQIRTPINKALWYMEMALEDATTKPMKDKLQVSYDALQSVAHLGEKIVMLSALDYGHISVYKKNIKAQDILAVLVSSVDKVRQRKQIKIKTQILPKSLAFMTDDRLLVRVLKEILDNALEYSRQGGVVSIHISRQNDDVIFEIVDAGVGVTEDQQAYVFDKFYRGTNIDKTKIHGAGLGLYIARELVFRLQGKIWFNSVEGKGSVFYVSLPIK